MTGDDRTALIRFTRGALTDDKTRARIDAAVPPGHGTVPGGLTTADRHLLTYRRLRHTGLAAPPAARLLDDPPALCRLLDRAAIADPALFHVMLLHYTLTLAPILRLGGPRAPRAARTALERFDTFGTLLMTELGRSNSHLSPRTLARHDPATGGFTLTTPDPGAAKFPTSTGHPALPKTAAVYATLVHGPDGHGGAEHGVFVFIVPLRDATGRPADGVRIVPAPETSGLRVDYAAVHLDGVRVPREAWLADGADLTPAGTFHDPAGSPAARLTRTMRTGPTVWRAIISMAAAITRASAGILTAHSTGRTTLGRLAPRRPLTDYRNQREAVLGALADAYALTAVAAHVQTPATPAPGTTPAPAQGDGTAAWAPWSAVDRDLTLLKAAATAQAQRTVTACRVHSGAPGFAADDRLNAYRGLAHAYQSAGGDNDLIAYDTARAMAALDRYTPPDPGPPPGRPPETILDTPAAWLYLARTAERRLRDRLAARISAARQAGADPFTAWNAHLPLAARAATAYADRAVLEIVAAALPAGEPAEGPLGGVLRLHAVNRLAHAAAVLLDEGIAEPGFLDAAAAARGRLCDALAPHTAALAAGLDLPPGIAAPAAALAP
ncbi:acyl-CoA dehydrogenase [Spirillospora albida]|uniref:acyl-CoA dehydrogenase family protein n=1 Tax=Spirillospora albida TaxID=58123 RepID=UPI0004C0F89C|nr:acyl-CoA dehydrogenase [Spirillospora albida]